MRKMPRLLPATARATARATGLAAALSIVTGLPAAAPLRAEEAAPAAETSVALPAITVVAAEMAPLRDVVLASGLVAAAEEVQVQPQIEGQAIDSISVEVGDMVTAGAEMARLSETALTLQRTQTLAQRASAAALIAQADAQLLEAQSAADEAVRVRDRTTALQAQGSASQAAADQAVANATAASARVTVAMQGRESARAQVALAEAQIADIDLKLKRTSITAPVDGEVIARNALVGAIASAAGAPLFTIVRSGELELRADVAEEDVLRLAANQTATLRAVGMTSRIDGKVRLVEPSVDTTTRLGRVRISIADSSTVRPGQFAEAEILVRAAEVLAVPITAVATTAGVATVLRVSADGVVSRVEVTTGIRDGGRIEITGGLAAGDAVVSRAGAFVRDGDRINPVMASGDTAAAPAATTVSN